MLSLSFSGSHLDLSLPLLRNELVLNSADLIRWKSKSVLRGLPPELRFDYSQRRQAVSFRSPHKNAEALRLLHRSTKS